MKNTISPLLVASAIAFWTCGCTESGNPSAQNSGDNGQQSELTEAEKCRTRLSSAIRRLQPETFALLSSRDPAANGLNAWLASCGGEQLMEMEVSEPTLTVLPASLHPIISAPRFSISDTQYIRDCIGMRRLADELGRRSGSGATEEDRIGSTFDWVVRNVSLTGNDEQQFPLELFDVLTLGRGTPEDRAWILAELLRQREIDVVIIRPNGESSGANDESESLIETADWLLAVVLASDVFLFDPVSGMPVADPNDTAVVAPAPAGLEVLEGSDRWKKITIQVVAQPMAFATRMFVLQEQLAAEDSAVFYEELAGGTTEIRPLVERVRSAGGELFANASIELWDYPEQQAAAAASRAQDQELAYAQLMKPFDAPFERRDMRKVPDLADFSRMPEELSAEEREAKLESQLTAELVNAFQSSDTMFGVPSHRLRKIRIRQVMGGDLAASIRELQQIRLASMEVSVSFRITEAIARELSLPPDQEIFEFPMPPAILNVNRSATGACLYWTAVCQIEQQQYGAAIATLQNYRRQYPDGQWKYASLVQEGLAELAEGNTQAAVDRLNEANQPDFPEQSRVQSLLKRLSPGE